MKFVPASHYSFGALTEAYNQTRVDYLVPMPMNEARLREYALVNDCDMDASVVAVNGDTIWGLGMLGVRHESSWITRLGVLPNGRRKGTGSAIMEALLEASVARSVRKTWLEVIKGNTPGHNLFRKFQFEETRELIVGRRPPQPPTSPYPNYPIKHVTYLEHNDAIFLLQQRQSRPNWLNATTGMRNVRRLPMLATMGERGTLQTARNISALLVELEDGSQGWVSYQATFLQLKHIIVEVLSGDPVNVTAAVLHTLHQHHMQQDAIVENIPDDASWQGFQKAGYFEAFRRIEMMRPL